MLFVEYIEFDHPEKWLVLVTIMTHCVHGCVLMIFHLGPFYRYRKINQHQIQLNHINGKVHRKRILNKQLANIDIVIFSGDNIHNRMAYATISTVYTENHCHHHHYYADKYCAFVYWSTCTKRCLISIVLTLLCLDKLKRWQATMMRCGYNVRFGKINSINSNGKN